MDSPPQRPTRRRFLRTSACAAVGSISIIRTIGDLQRVAAAAGHPHLHGSPVIAGGDYRALVCIFLYGGNDGNNTVIPRGNGYAGYAAGRGGLAIPAAQLLPITPLQSDGRQWALHPGLPGLQGLFAQQRLAILGNVGPLVEPVTRAEYDAGTAELPPQLFSHSDQTVHWQTSLPDQMPRHGWGGRIADLLYTLNENSQVSMAISLGGSNTFQIGRFVTQYQLSPYGTMGLDAYNTGPNPDAVSLGIRQILAKSYGNLLERGARDVTQRAIDNDILLSAALDAAPEFPNFPDTDLGSQLRMVAKMIASRDTLNQRRQVFFCATGGYDTHDDQLAPHAELLSELDAALVAFNTATVEMGVPQSVTTFTASDFGRTYPASGEGSDHGWGNIQLIMGGSVRGGNIYGRMPVLVEDGPDDTEQGRWIPSTSVDEYAATLASWFGVAASDIPLVLPNIGRFAMPNLGFML